MTDSWPRLREAGDAGALLQWDPVIDAAVNARAIAAADAVRSKRIAGVRDVVSTFRSVAVYFDPLIASIETVREALLSSATTATDVSSSGRSVEVPVTYGGDEGPDLSEVGAMTGMTEAEIVRRHADATYRVFMLGFLPGFAYMASVDESIAVPRRATPRVRVPAGSVGIAGRQTGVYPIDSPGGWQIVGRTSMPVFDPMRSRPCLFAPGDSVRFVDVGRLKAAPTKTGHLKVAPTPLQSPVGSALPSPVGSALPSPVGSALPSSVGSVLPSPVGSTLPSPVGAALPSPVGAALPSPVGAALPSPVGSAFRRTVTVVTPGLFTTVQDEGRWGYQGSGVSVSGPMDLVSHRIANIVVGNDRSAATLEITLHGPELRLNADAVVAIAGADLKATIDGAAIDLCTQTRCRSGSVIRFGSRRSGTRAYLAVDGGIDLPRVLDSRSTHATTHIGGFAGRQLRAGDTLPIGESGHSRRASRRAPLDPRPRTARLRAIPGPQDDFFAESAFDILQQTRFTVSPQSNRMGYRLTGGPPIPRADEREMISDATFAGALQVPPSGDPILLMADRQTTGGYPQIATVITADLPLAGQLAPGDSVEFELCSRSQAIAALVAQEARLLALV